jgi:Uma2 family endonuclease
MVPRLTVEQVEGMLERGLLADGAPLELIDGVLVHKDRSDTGGDPMTIGERHNLTVQLLNELHPELQRHGCWLQIQGPVRIPPYDEPEPDGAVIAGQRRDYMGRLPGPVDVHAVIEVSHSSLTHDRRTKLALYARAAIAQYVIVNLRQDCVEVHERPVPAEELYEALTVLRRGDRLALRTGEGLALEVDIARLLP